MSSLWECSQISWRLSAWESCTDITCRYLFGAVDNWLDLERDTTNLFFKYLGTREPSSGFICAKPCPHLASFFDLLPPKWSFWPLQGHLAYWMPEQRKWSSSSRVRNGICQNCIYLSVIIFPNVVPKPHLSGELVRWSRAFLQPGVSSGFASYKTSFSHPLADNWQK